MRRSVQRRCNRRERGQYVDDHHRAVDGDDDSSRRGCDAADRGDRNKNSFPASPICERSCQGGYDRRWHHAQLTITLELSRIAAEDSPQVE